jgi:lambda family phage tail tape measure protein
MSTFNLDWQVDTSQIDKLVQQLQATKDKAQSAATALDGVKTNLNNATAATHEFSLANAGVVRELSVMFGEAMRGNWTRLEGSMTVLANRTGLLAMAFTPLGAAIGATVAAVGLLGLAAHQGAQEQERLTVALAMSGNAAGATAGSLIDLSRAAGEVSGNLSGAKEAIAKLTESGRFTESQMNSIGTAAAEMARVTGQNVDKIVGEFVKLADQPVKASLELNKQYHYLTAATYEQIAALERQGRTEEAAGAASQAYAEAVKKRSDEIIENLGYLQKAANKTGQFFTSMWQAITGIGREQTIGEQLKAAQDQVSVLQKAVDSGHGGPQAQAKLDAAKQQMLTFEAALHDQQRLAARDADKQMQNDRLVADQQTWDKIEAQSKTRAQKLAEEIAKIRSTGQELGKSPTEIQNQVNAYLAAHSSHTHVNNSDNNNAIEAIRGQIEQRKQLYELDLTNLQTSLAKGQITQEDFDKQKEQLHVQELQDDMDYAQKAAAIAKSKGANFKTEYTNWINAYNKYKADIDLAHAQEEKSEADHAARIQKIMQSGVAGATAFNSQRSAALDKANRQQYMTPQEKTDADAREAIEIKYQTLIDSEVQKLKDAKATTDDVSKAVADLNQKKQDALDQEQAAMQQRLKLQSDWQVGAQLAFKKYQESAANTAAQTEQLFTSAFSNMENALVTFTTTGKFNFSSFATSIITDLIRMEIRAEETKVLGYLGQMFGFGSTGGGAAIGGVNGSAGAASLSTFAANGMAFSGGVPGMYASGTVVNGPRFFAGGAGLMGEAGPEAIMPLKRGADGRLGVASSGGGSGGQIVTFGDFHFTINGNIQDEATAQAMQQQMVAQLATVIADQRISNSWRTGGLSYNAART